MNPITINRVLKKKIMLSLLIIGSVNGLSQSFLIPPMLDTIYFDASRYPDIHEGDTIYELGSYSKVVGTIFFTRLNQLVITKIDIVDYSSYQELELYLHSFFNRRIQTEVINFWQLEGEKYDEDVKSNFRIARSDFVVKFDKQIVAVSDAKGPLIVGDELHELDLISYKLKSDKELYEVTDASLCSVEYSDGSIQTLYTITTTDMRDWISLFYIVVENNEIVDWYQYAH